MPRGAVTHRRGVLSRQPVNDPLWPGGSVHKGVRVHTGGSGGQAEGVHDEPPLGKNGCDRMYTQRDIGGGGST